MRERWRTLVRPESHEPSTAHDPNHALDPSEAFGVWMLGVLWALACLWLGYLGKDWVIPGVLLAGLLALWGWRHMEWLWWFPTVLVVATMFEPMSPLPLRSRFGPLVYIDLLTIGVGLVAIVRALGLGRPLLPKTPVDGLVLAILMLSLASLFPPLAHPSAMIEFKQLLVRLAVFYATTTVASRPRGSRWVWIAFPLTSALIGLHALWAVLRGPHLLGFQSHAADVVWGSRLGIFNTLLIALPVSAGLALTAGDQPARRVWMFATVAGSIGLGLHLAGTDVLQALAFAPERWDALEVARTLLVWVTLGTVAWLALRVRKSRMHEGTRWTGIAVTLVVFALIEPFGSALSGPSVPLLSVASGLVMGTLRADRRAARRERIRARRLAEAA